MFRIAFLLWFLSYAASQVPDTSTTWELTVSGDSSKWSARNAHASCVFLNRIWLVGGHTDLYPFYNLEYTDKAADVWYSDNGVDWTQIVTLRGDFYAQNFDVKQPGPIAPFYARYGHSLDPIDIDHDGVDDVMVMMGGFAPGPANDVWVSENGHTWFFVGFAPWSARAWHATAVFNNTLWVFGGTPLNNEIWRMTNLTKLSSRTPPLTRATYMPYTYEMQWEQLNDAAWSPRCAMGLVKQYCKTCSTPADRLILVGGYGGPLTVGFDGLRSRSDIWQTFDGKNWTKLADTSNVGANAWIAMSVWERRPDASHNDRMWAVGGGYIGDYLNKRVSVMTASLNTFWSYDGIYWQQVNYKLGGGRTGLARYSSEEWARTTVDGSLTFLGVWGATLEVITKNGTSEMFLLGGDQDGEGTLISDSFQAMPGLYCDIEGVPCSGQGVCGSTFGEGCVCNQFFTGAKCDIPIGSKKSAAPVGARPQVLVGAAVTFIAVMIVSGL